MGTETKGKEMRLDETDGRTRSRESFSRETRSRTDGGIKTGKTGQGSAEPEGEGARLVSPRLTTG